VALKPVQLTPDGSLGVLGAHVVKIVDGAPNTGIGVTPLPDMEEETVVLEAVRTLKAATSKNVDASLVLQELSPNMAHSKSATLS